MQRILILRPDNIGDCVLFSGALKYIRKHWPEARINLAVKPHIVNLFELCPHIDRVFSLYRFFPWLFIRQYFYRGTWLMERLLRKENILPLWYPEYDVVIYPVDSHTEEMLEVVRLIPAKEKLGFCGCRLNLRRMEDPANAPEKVFSFCYDDGRENEWKHELPRLERFLKACGIEAGDVTPEFWLPEQDEKYAAELLPEKDFLGIFPGADKKEKIWPCDKWHDLLNEQNLYRHVVIFGSKSDFVLARQIAGGVKGDHLYLIDLTGRTTLRQLVACIKRCGALVSADSAGLHIATASDVPSVGLMGGYHYGRFYPWGDPAIHRVAKVDMDCYHCNFDCRYGDYRCVRDIPVEMVLGELKKAMSNER